MNSKLPAKVKRTGMRQLSISLGEAQAKELERIRVDSGLRSWGQVIRMLIADAMVRRVITTSATSAAISVSMTPQPQPAGERLTNAATTEAK